MNIFDKHDVFDPSWNHGKLKNLGIKLVFLHAFTNK